MKKHREMKWLLTATAVCLTEKITSFSSVVRPHKLLAPRPVLWPLLPARRLAAHRPAERCLPKNSSFTPKYLLLKLCPTGCVKKYYWGHRSYTWVSAPKFSCRQDSEGSEVNILASHFSRHEGAQQRWCQSSQLCLPSWDSISLYLVELTSNVACLTSIAS